MIHPLIHEFQLDFDDVNKKLVTHVEQEIKRTTGLDASARHSNIGGWHSERDLDAKLGDGSPSSNRLLQLFAGFSEPMMEFIRAYPAKFETIVKESYDWNYAGAWFNIAFGGSYNAPHTHPGSQISAAYYIRTEESTKEYPFSGKIDFIHENIQYGCHPTDGTLILFPSTMLHWVHPYYGSKLRICLSFNAKNIQ